MSGDGNKDLHAILGVKVTAGPDELRRAYLSLAVKYHPDRNPGDSEAEERFKDISQAYAVLSDPTARARYERLMRARRESASAAGSQTEQKAAGGSSAAGQAAGAAGRRPGTSSTSGQSNGASNQAGASSAERPERDRAGAKNGSTGAGSANSAETDFEDILNGFFKSAKGRDLLKDLENELNKAGVKFNFDDFTRWIKNRKANIAASEAKPLWRRLADWLTGAEARARKEAARFDISYQLSLSSQAASAGTTVEISYPRDGGDHRLKIRIPGGARDGSRVRLPGQGRLKPDGDRGDLVLTVQVGPRQSVADLWK